MKMQPVQSSFIDSVGYDATTGSITVQFANGSRQKHDNVSQDEYKDLINAESVGGHYNSNFRNKPVQQKPAIVKNLKMKR